MTVALIVKVVGCQEGPRSTCAKSQLTPTPALASRVDSVMKEITRFCMDHLHTYSEASIGVDLPRSLTQPIQHISAIA